MAIPNSKVAWLMLLLAGGCAQILGLSDYEVDPKLDGATGEGGAGNPEGGSTGQGGEPMAAGADGEGGEPTVSGGGPGAGGEGGGAACDSPDSPECCAAEGGTPVEMELLEDGGFELGTAAEGNTPWTEVSINDLPLITDGFAETVTPRTGNYLAFLAGVMDEISSLQSENHLIPAGAGWFEVSGFRWSEIDGETDPLNKDFMSIGLFNFADDSLEELPFFWDRTSATPTWTRFAATVPAAPHVGKTLYLLLLAQADDVTDGSIPAGGSNFMVDEVSLKLFTCQK